MSNGHSEVCRGIFLSGRIYTAPNPLPTEERGQTPLSELCRIFSTRFGLDMAPHHKTQQRSKQEQKPWLKESKCPGLEHPQHPKNNPPNEYCLHGAINFGGDVAVEFAGYKPDEADEKDQNPQEHQNEWDRAQEHISGELLFGGIGLDDGANHVADDE